MIIYKQENVVKAMIVYKLRCSRNSIYFCLVESHSDSNLPYHHLVGKVILSIIEFDLPRAV